MFAFALDFMDFVVIMVIVSGFGAGAAAVFNTQDKARLARLELQLDCLLAHAGLELDADAQLPEDVRKALQEEEGSSA